MSTVQNHQSTTAAPAEVPSGPWWHYPHMWMVVGGPLIVVVAGFITLWLAISRPDPVYSDDPRANRPAARQAGDDAVDSAMTPAMQGRNHAATGGVAHPDAAASAPGQRP